MEEHQQKLMYLFWHLSMWSEDDISLLCHLVHGIIISEDMHFCFHGTKPAGLSEPNAHLLNHTATWSVLWLR